MWTKEVWPKRTWKDVVDKDMNDPLLRHQAKLWLIVNGGEMNRVNWSDNDNDRDAVCELNMNCGQSNLTCKSQILISCSSVSFNIQN